MTVPPEAYATHIDRLWTDHAVPALVDYVAVPALSPNFDSEWNAHGHLRRVVEDAATFVRAHLPDARVEIRQPPGLTPLLVIECEGTAGALPGTVLAYGHLDKQPEMTGWREGLGPWTPVVEEGRLYGRGGADDGYAVYSLVCALAALRAGELAHSRVVGLFETSEESASTHLEAHLAGLADLIGSPDLVLCLDSGCGDYDRLWATTSLRGNTVVTLTVEVLTEGVHSGDAGGIVPSSFAVMRQLLDRVEDSATGRVKLAGTIADVPEERRRQAAETALLIDPVDHLPWAGSCHPLRDGPAEALLARTWAPALEVIGADGIPPGDRAGNVLRPSTALTLSLRLPPGVDPDLATDQLIAALTEDPPHGALVTAVPHGAAAGWDAPPTADWLDRSLRRASDAWFGHPPGAFGEGGTIPFMALLGRRFPGAQFLITGVLGPHSNAHGPNEFLHLDYARRLTGAVASILSSHGSVDR